MNPNSQISNPPSPLPPPSIRRAARVARATVAELPNMPTPTMPPIFVIVAFNRQQRRWRIAGSTDQEFNAGASARSLRPTHHQHARIYKLSEEAQ